MPSRNIGKYLAHYAEPEASSVTAQRFSFNSTYQQALVIPACREQAADIRRVWQHLDNSNLLIVVVINSASPGDVITQSLLVSLSKDYETREANGIIHCTQSLSRRPEAPDLLLVDRCSPGHEIPLKQGVGLARKIGCDILVNLHASGLLESQWIATTDADAVLPADYFSTSADPMAVSAMLYPFHHEPDTAALKIPAALYELHMLHYAAALRWAGSPYGFPTVGSTIRCSVEHYARVRGFPKRNTGEDFYLLNKLCKTGKIQPIDVAPVALAGRLSDRVPIGTGQALARISALDNPLADFPFDHPQCFVSLKRLLRGIEAIAANEADRSANIRRLTEDKEFGAYVESAGLLNTIRAISPQQPSSAVMHKHLMDWFDALKTRQFIHWMRDQHYGHAKIEGLLSADYVDLDPNGLTASATMTRLRDWFHRMIYSSN